MIQRPQLFWRQEVIYDKVSRIPAIWDWLIPGAELIEEMRIKRMDEQVEEEHRILEKIKIKMDRIKANQQKIQGDRNILKNQLKFLPILNRTLFTNNE